MCCNMLLNKGRPQASAAAPDLFYDILKKIVILEVWQSFKIQVVKHVLRLPNLKVRPDLRFVENNFLWASNEIQIFCYGLFRI